MNIGYLRHMVVFSHIVETGGISSAAERLKVSKSVVSQQLKALEKELGVSLINRSTRSQALTAAGRAFYQHCLSLNNLVDHAWSEARESQGLVLGGIRISAPNALVGPIVGPALGRLVEEHEGIKPTLLGNDKRVDLINDEIHLAIRVGKMQSSDYKQRKLGEFRDVLCASPEFLKKHAIDQDVLLKHAGMNTHFNYVANSWQGTHITHRLKHKHQDTETTLIFSANRLCNTLPAVVSMACAGCGFAYIPDFVFNEYRKKGELIEAMPDYLGESAPIYAVHAYAGQVPILVRLSIDAIQKQLERMELTLAP